MHRPTARLLTLLELLQEMGIPVEGEHGRYGAYSLRRGYKMPPMMFTDEEAVGLSLGLLAARRLGLSGVAPAVEGALAKVERVMPEALRQRLRALGQTATPSIAPPATLPDGEVALDLAGAVGARRRVRLRYRSAQREETRRVVDPYAVLQREGRWHLFGYCHLRRDMRLFRLDRMLEAEVLEESFERPPGLDAPETLLRAVAKGYGPWEFEVLLETSMERAREQVTPMVAFLEEAEGGVLMRGTADDLDSTARLLAGLFCPFAVRKPPELRVALGRHAAELARLAERTGDEGSGTVQVVRHGAECR